jgi:hypothetical protein
MTEETPRYETMEALLRVLVADATLHDLKVHQGCRCSSYRMRVLAWLWACCELPASVDSPFFFHFAHQCEEFAELLQRAPELATAKLGDEELVVTEVEM